MVQINARRLLAALFVFALGCGLGGTFARADKGGSSVFDLTVDACDQVLDVDGRVSVEGGRGFVVFQDAARQDVKVEVRGWDAIAKRGLVGNGASVRVAGLVLHGSTLEYRGHVTVLK